MNKSDKKKRVVEIVEQLQEIYPELDRVVITDLDDPSSIIITSKKRMREEAELLGIDPELLEEATDHAEDILTIDDLSEDDDEDDNGTLH